MTDHVARPSLQPAIDAFDRALAALRDASVARRPHARLSVLRAADPLLDDEQGLGELFARAPRFEGSGLFAATPWEDPSRLVPALVKPGVLRGGPDGTIEHLSELRVLSLARASSASRRMTRGEAQAFLERVLALGLDLLVPVATEEARAGGATRRRAERLYGFLARSLPLYDLLENVTHEIEQICEQRQVLVDRAREMIRLARRVALPPGRTRPERLERFIRAVEGPTELARRAGPDPEAYARALAALDPRERDAETHAFGRSLRGTGLACPLHATLLRALRGEPRGLARALGLNAHGRAELVYHAAFVDRLIRHAIHPRTAQSIYGLAGLLERGLLSRPEVAAGLRRLLVLSPAPAVRERLARFGGDALSPAAILVAGSIAVLGQPLGLGQGRNPTCQASRGISLWSELAPGHLLALLASVARAERIELLFEGELLRSDALDGGLAPELDPELDPVSLLLVPHIDRLYDEMMRRVADRPGDGHRWVNPALYGPWIGPHLAVVGEMPYEAFVRHLFATHHPTYSGHYGMIHPTPVGLYLTNAHGVLLGLHAITLQRVTVDPSGAARAFFFNPNDEGRQDWGGGIVPAVSGHGEREGESSLPFHQLASRLYAFHYTLYEDDWGATVPRAEVERVTALARESWGRAVAGVFQS